MDDAPAVLVDVETLAARLAGQARIVLLDVRWALGRVDGRAQYEAGHLPGAVFVDLDGELAAPGSPRSGRHPLPTLDDLQVAARRWGVRQGDTVVVYDASGGLAAARAWWLLRWAGLRDVLLLDGGLSAWTAGVGALETGAVTAPPGDVTLPGPGHLPTVDAEDVARLARTGVVPDARAGERYRGESEPVDPVAGHVPGAVSSPTTSLLDAGGRFLPPERLRAHFAALGALGAPRAVYCGSGVTAAHTVAALASLGVTAALYPGSWSQWSNDPARPVATGPDPG